jgi:hypothetical protein
MPKSKTVDVIKVTVAKSDSIGLSLVNGGRAFLNNGVYNLAIGNCACKRSDCGGNNENDYQKEHF